MKLSGYIIEKYNCMAGSYTCHRLVDEAKQLGVELKIIGVNDCFIADAGVVNRDYALQDVDFVINRYKWGRVKDVLNSLARKAYNGLTPFNVYVNKYEQIKHLRSDEFFIPKYILGTSSLSYSDLASELRVPFVAKGLESSMGREVMLIRNDADFALLRQYPLDKEWLFEEFIAESYGRDLRLFCIRGKAVACMMRQSDADFRANVALGADVKAVAIDSRLEQIARDVYEQTGLDFVGVDLLFGKQGYYLCEINVMPGLEGIEKASGVNIAKEILCMIVGDLQP
jgi:RimK family alpha-L-glutamate ligase